MLDYVSAHIDAEGPYLYGQAAWRSRRKPVGIDFACKVNTSPMAFTSILICKLGFCDDACYFWKILEKASLMKFSQSMQVMNKIL